jgi:hypothetical protein
MEHFPGPVSTKENKHRLFTYSFPDGSATGSNDQVKMISAIAEIPIS